MKVHMGAGARFVEVEVKDGYCSLAELRVEVLKLWRQTVDQRVEAMAVGFSADRAEPWEDTDEQPGADPTRSRPRRRLGGIELAGADRLAAQPS